MSAGALRGVVGCLTMQEESPTGHHYQVTLCLKGRQQSMQESLGEPQVRSYRASPGA